MKIEKSCKEIIELFKTDSALGQNEFLLIRTLRDIEDDLTSKPNSKKLSAIFSTIRSIREFDKGKGTRIAESSLMATLRVNVMCFKGLDLDEKTIDELINIICDFSFESISFTKQRDFFAADRRQLALGILEEALSYFAIPEALELSLSFLEKSKNRQEQNSALSFIGEYSYQCEDSFVEYKKQVCHSLKNFIKINKHESTRRAAKLLEGLRNY